MVGYRAFFIVRWQFFCRIGIFLFFCMVTSMSMTMLFPLPAFALSAGVTVSQTASTVTINASADLQSCELNYPAKQQIGWQAVGGWLGSCAVRGFANVNRSIQQFPTVDSIIPSLFAGSTTGITSTITPITRTDGACYEVRTILPYSVSLITVRKSFPACTTSGIMDVYLDGRWVGGVFYGSNKVSKQISLPRSSLSVGAHVAKVIVRSGLTKYAPALVTATASFTTACGLNVTITPAKAIVEPTLNNRRSWMQKAGANQTSVVIDVKDPNNQPVTNAQFTMLGVETVPGAETYGGHDHATDPNNALTKPTGIWGAIKNLGNGQYSSTYTASMFASMEQLYTTVSAGGCEGLAVSPPIEAKIQGLQPIILPLGGLVHSFVGGTCKHYGATTPWSPNKLASCNGATGTSNIYLTPFRENLLHQLLFAYAKEWNAGLYINDASLKFGGAFDTNGDWAYKPHSNHRLGLDVDIALKENIPPIGTSPTNVSGKTLKRKLNSIILSDPVLKNKWVASLHKNHIHLKPNFKKGSWTGK